MLKALRWAASRRKKPRLASSRFPFHPFSNDENDEPGDAGAVLGYDEDAREPEEGQWRRDPRFSRHLASIASLGARRTLEPGSRRDHAKRQPGRSQTQKEATCREVREGSQTPGARTGVRKVSLQREWMQYMRVL